MALQPWIRSRRRRNVATSLSFNGAMALQPWILGERAGFIITGLKPSMEPWPFSHGYVRTSAAPSSAACLQWSHGPSAMDTALAFGSEALHNLPSMEPWPFSHGYLAKSISDDWIHTSFNGAMALQPWIPMLSSSSLYTSSPFNGAMALQPWIQRNNRDCSPGLPRPHSNFRIQRPFHHPIAAPVLALPSF